MLPFTLPVFLGRKPAPLDLYPLVTTSGGSSRPLRRYLAYAQRPQAASFGWESTARHGTFSVAPP